MNKTTALKRRGITYNTLAVCIMLFYCYNYTLSTILYQSKIVIVFSFLVSIFLCLISVFNSNRIICDKYTILWLLGLVIALINNRRIAVGDFAPKMLCWFTMIICLLLLRNSYKWIEIFIKWIYGWTWIHIFFAWLMKTVPSLFYMYVNLFDGTSRATMLSHYNSGYLLGLTTHYSTLAIYLGNGLVVLWVLYNMENDIKRKRHLLMSIIIAGITLFMVGKRGMLIFVICTLFIYSILVKTKDIRKIFSVSLKYIAWIVVCVCALFFLAYTVMPQLQVTIGRFLYGTVGTDITSGRGKMWELAIDLFLDNPIKGIGWFGYREAYSKAWYHGGLFQQLDTHNVYFQLLCETGLIGFIIFCYAMFNTLCLTIKNLRKCIFKSVENSCNYYKEVLAVSSVIQILFLLYCLTGNPLYDPQNFIVYFLGVAASYAVQRRIRKEIL